MSVWPGNVALQRAERTRGSRFPFERGRQKRPVGKTFDRSGISAEILGKTGRLRSDQENRHNPGNRGETANRGRYLGSSALFEVAGWMERPVCALRQPCEESH